MLPGILPAIGGWAVRNPLAAGLGALAIAASIGAGVQTLRLAWCQGELAREQLAFADFKTAQAVLVANQAREDARLSADLLARQADRLAGLNALATTHLQRIEHAAVTFGCGPVMRDSSRGVRQLFEGGSGPGNAPAGSRPAAPLR